MNILLVVNKHKDPSGDLTSRVVTAIGERGYVFVVQTEQIASLSLDLPAKGVTVDDIQVIMVLGGDGTLLSIAKLAAEHEIPVVGVNLGRLGFLSEIEQNEIEEGMNRLFSGDYIIEERMMLKAVLLDGTETLALNDVVVSRSHAALKILETDVYIDDEYVDEFKADGIIVATPTGSTAYSLSAGGPIVDPALDSMIITPVCPHKMYSRTIIVPPSKSIKVACRPTADHEAFVAADSIILGKLSGTASVKISVSQKRLQLIRFKDYSFFGILHNKLVRKKS